MEFINNTNDKIWMASSFYTVFKIWFDFLTFTHPPQYRQIRLLFDTFWIKLRLNFRSLTWLSFDDCTSIRISWTLLRALLVTILIICTCTCIALQPFTYYYCYIHKNNWLYLQSKQISFFYLYLEAALTTIETSNNSNVSGFNHFIEGGYGFHLMEKQPHHKCFKTGYISNINSQ